MFWTTVLVNVGMWLERFLIFVPSLTRKTPLTFNWGTFHPSLLAILMVSATFAWVALGMLLFARLFPLVPLFDIKEGMVFRDEIKIGRATVPASIRE